MWIALAGSLKFVPLVLVAVYLVRRQWARAAWAVGVTILLVAPMLAFDLSGYSSDFARTYALWTETPVIAALVALAAALAVWRWRREPVAWFMAGALVMALSPRLHLSGMGYLARGFGHGRRTAMTVWKLGWARTYE